MRFAGIDPEHNAFVRVQNKVDHALQLLERRLGANEWLAGSEFSAADVMTVFSLTGMREFCPLDLSAYGNVLKYLQRVQRREGYRRAMAKGDPDVDFESLAKGEPPQAFVGLRKMAEEAKRE